MGTKWTLDKTGAFRWTPIGYRVLCQHWNVDTNEWDDVGLFKHEQDMRDSVKELQ